MKVLELWVSIAQDDGVVEALGGRAFMVVDIVGAVAMHIGLLLFNQNTSRQQAVTPRFGGRLEKEGEEVRREDRDGLG